MREGRSDQLQPQLQWAACPAESDKGGNSGRVAVGNDPLKEARSSKLILKMKKIEYKTPEELKILTDKTRSETAALVKKLKKKKPKDLDDFVHGLHIDAFAQFSCLDCANCCKTIGPRLTDKDIDRLAKHLKMRPSDFMKQYVLTDEDGDFVFRDHPCPFLLPDNYCMVYENRPKACREYPHTDRKRFYQILPLSHKNCETCPVVYEIFEEIKTQSW